MKKYLMLLLSVCLAGMFCFCFVGCGGTSNEEEQVTCTFHETVERANGESETNEYVARYVGARLTIKKEYEEGTYYTYSYDIDSSSGNIVGASSGDLGSCGPKPGTYYMEAPINDTGSFRFTLEIIINEPVDPRVTPQVAFDPNGAVDYEDGVRYVYEYDGEEHYPMIYGIYEDKKITPDYEELYEDGIVAGLNESGENVGIPRGVGTYILTYRIEDGKWANEEDNAKYYGIYAQITVEIIEKAGPPKSLNVVSKNHKIQYDIGEKLDLTGLEVEVIYQSGKQELLLLNEEMITGFDSSQPAVNQVLTIRYENLTTTYVVQIGKPYSFDIMWQDGKLIYRVGEQLNLDNIQIALNYSSTEEKSENVLLKVQPNWVKGFNSYQPGEQLLTIEYEVWDSWTDSKKMMSRNFYVFVTEGDIYSLSNVKTKDFDGNPYQPSSSHTLEDYQIGFIELKNDNTYLQVTDYGTMFITGGYWSLENGDLILDNYIQKTICSFDNESIQYEQVYQSMLGEKYIVELTFVLTNAV